MLTPRTAWVLCLTLAAPAWARPPEREPAEALWVAEVSFDAPAELDVTTPAGAESPVSRNATIQTRLAAAYYLHPLVDEAEGPLALIPFYQHPGALRLSAGTDDHFARVDNDWSNTRHGLAVDASAEGYPWHETGLLASAGASFAGIAGLERSAVQARYSAGVVRYFRPNLRAELAYVGTTTEDSRAIQSPQAPALQDRLSVTNAGRMAGEAALLEDRLSVRMEVQLGQFTEDRTAVALAGTNLPGDYTHGLLFGFQAQATGYLGRRLSGTLGGGLTGQSGTTTPDSATVGASDRQTLTPLLQAGLQYFPLDNLWLRLSYQLALPRTRGTNIPETDAYANSVALSVLGRI